MPLPSDHQISKNCAENYGDKPVIASKMRSPMTLYELMVSPLAITNRAHRSVSLDMDATRSAANVSATSADVCPEIVERSEWNAREPIYGPETEEPAKLQLPLKNMVYTQTYSGWPCMTREDCKITVKVIQDDHMGFGATNNKFSDIGYHFLIGMDGSVFEGRGWFVKAAYNRPYNSQGFGVAFIGTFPATGNHTGPLTYAALVSGNRLLRCALFKGFLVATGYTVVASRISTVVGNYVRNPKSFPQMQSSPTSTMQTNDAVTTTSALSLPIKEPVYSVLTKEAIIAISVGCSALLVISIVVAILYCRRRVKRSQKPVVGLGMQQDGQALTATSSENQVNVTEWFGSDCAYRYEANDYIAKGAFGRVYIATVTKLRPFNGDATMAVKVTHFDVQEQMEVNSEHWIKLLTRWRMLTTLTYDHLVTYHKVSIIRPRGGLSVEFLMDYCRGGDLASELHKIKKSNVCLDWTRALCYALQIADGLEFLHRHKLIHGDLKPGNVLLKGHNGRHDTLLIGDLDSLVQMHHNTTSATDMSHLHGTVRYMSPEMLKRFGELDTPAPGRATDIWSVGCIIHDLFDCSAGILVRVLRKIDCNDFVVQDATIPATFAMKIMEGYSPVVDENIRTEFADVIKNCLVLDSKGRPSADCLKCTLLDVIAGLAAASDTDTVAEMDTVRQCVCGRHLPVEVPM
ncbi:uncharacterized protein LOC129592298 isoform X2 [Paramacrobiotus metropolitanus]|nr:uncharacterized protein LOC129592298 isoform X2 [Paramacrobiotus metropolitanus]